jgi:leader peptidase (prepilin peptidase)/N-methyltransferase
LWWIVAAFVFVVGACVGSFLNVVIYRLPKGKSVIRPGSQCPTCGHAIRWYDNVPVVSWLVLRGRCRDCGACFSGRYSVVELATAILFVVSAAAGPLAGGPRSLGLLYDARIWTSFALHATLGSTLIAIALIRIDGHRVPRVLAVLLLALVIMTGLWHFVIA